MNQSVVGSSHKPYPKLFAALFLGLIVATVGLFTGQYVPPALFLPLAIVEIVMIFMMIFARKRKSMGYMMMFAFMFISGLTLYPAISYYVSAMGADVVLRAAAITAVAFGGTALYAVISKRDFRFIGGFLFISVIALFFMGILQIFFPVSGTAELIYSAFGIFIFIGYTLYDFSRLTLNGFTDRDIPMIVVSIYLDIVNLFLFILRFIGVLNDD
ncbi:Bax inhibitor-1/YccA family protein [Pullulanibacillus pueri]|nr:Bax inhibitor-1/YccA family protein [Pullulanibacillus pueri]